ncbi:MAG: cell division protein FtsZ, partial [Desulfobacterales bacterium]|nr:cell division protein FtsZ [Desulfobacterales bacterium]
LEDASISGAKGVLINITCSSDLTMEEMTEASERIYNEVGNNAEIIWGTVIDDNLGEEMRVTVIATGIGSGPESSMKDKHGERSKASNVMDFPFSPTNNNSVDLDRPTFMRNEEATNDSAGFVQKKLKRLVGDNNDLDVPAFLRKDAN